MPVRRILPCALAALLLAACTDSDTQPIASTVPATTATSAAAEPVIELGDFDPEGDFTVFDPCTEIPAEVLAEAGLGEPVGEPYYDGNMSVLCSGRLTTPDHSGVVGLSGDRFSKERIEELNLILGEASGTDLDGAYLHALPGDAGNDCSAAISTTRGRFVVNYNEPLFSGDRQELCSVALSKLEIIVKKMGEINGNLS
ncbi:MAG: DUF3558 family protein [Corynebacterium sp.]|uniref:DUF3558 family protein n=1 Tax=Corynebacterium sp. TaxID=1720 RepID=UPI0026E0424C|nr:DUF3558 family protein [Corynebacterium sp.]MDO5668741.1 DUF3558 family protein [Corynebacterium sp.]